MGSFVRKVKTGSGATAVQIMHKRGQRVLGLEHIGSAHTPAEVVLLEAAATARLHAGQEPLPLEFDPNQTVARPAHRSGLDATVTGTASLVLWEALERLYADLGFGVVKDEAFKQLVLARIVEPTSKADTVRVLGDLFQRLCRT